MSIEACLGLMADMLRVTLYVVGPLLAASLIAGLAVGVVQTATQVNEPSVSYVVKAACVMGVLLAMGGTIAAHMTGYARQSFRAVGDVVRR